MNLEKLWHEVFLNAANEIVIEADPKGEILNKMEVQNHKALEYLTEQWYLLADTLKRCVQQISEARNQAQRSVVTCPYTRERQESLVGILTASGWFKATNRGITMNCNDAIIVLELERLGALDKELSKRKAKALE